MTHSFVTREQPAPPAVTKSVRIGGIGFDRLMAVLCCGFVGGIYLDGWAHDHGRVDQTFFTPWHAVLYAAYFACALVLLGAVLINRRHSQSWRTAVPPGYELAVLGVPLFLASGEGDLIWHALFGFEVGIEPLLSPSQLLLAFSGILILSSPLRAAWRRTDSVANQRWGTLLPALLSLLAVFSIFTFFTEFAHPLVHPRLVQAALSDDEKSWGVASVLVQATVLMGFVLLALRRWRLPLGTFTLIFTVNGALMSVLLDQQRLIPGICLAGIFADLLYLAVQPSAGRVGALRLFAFCVPLVYFLGYFVTFILTGGTNWSIHLWLGASVMSGIIGLGLSYLLVPPAGPVTYEESEQ
jgi:hypothetical protein